MKWIIPIIAVLFIGSCMNSCIEENNWQEFKKENNCKIIERKNGRYGSGFTSNGKYVMTHINGQDCWLCDDGIKYWRDKE